MGDRLWAGKPFRYVTLQPPIIITSPSKLKQDQEHGQEPRPNYHVPQLICILCNKCLHWNIWLYYFSVFL